MGQFTQNISAFVAKTGLAADVVLRKLALDGFKGVVVKSPVDTGRFRSSWRVGIDAVDLSVEPEVIPPVKSKVKVGEAPDSSKLGDAESKLATAKFGMRIAITNNIVYGPPLESGSSKQAPSGMLALTLVEINTGLANAIAGAK